MLLFFFYGFFFNDANRASEMPSAGVDGSDPCRSPTTTFTSWKKRVPTHGENSDPSAQRLHIVLRRHAAAVQRGCVEPMRHKLPHPAHGTVAAAT